MIQTVAQTLWGNANALVFELEDSAILTNEVKPIVMFEFHRD